MSQLEEGKLSQQSQPDGADVGGQSRFPSSLQWDQLPDVLTVVDAAQVMRVGRSTMYEVVKQGQIPSIKIGRKILIAKSALMKLVSQH